MPLQSLDGKVDISLVSSEEQTVIDVYQAYHRIRDEETWVDIDCLRKPNCLKAISAILEVISRCLSKSIQALLQLENHTGLSKTSWHLNKDSNFRFLFR